jgi:hypothetical protein
LGQLIFLDFACSHFEYLMQRFDVCDRGPDNVTRGVRIVFDKIKFAPKKKEFPWKTG